MTGLLRGHVLALVFMTGLLTACAPQVQRPDPALDQALIEAERSQDPVRLASALWRKAEASPPHEQAHLQLRAIEILIDANKLQNALGYLRDKSANRAGWARFEPRREHIVLGFEALQQGRTADAIRLLQDIPAPLAQAEAERRLDLIASALASERRLLDAARQRIVLDTLLTGERREANQNAILGLLQGMEQAAFDQALLEIMDPNLGGWLQLVKADRDGADKLMTWRQSHPSHPLLAVIFERLLRDAALRVPLIVPHVALILSQDPRLADAARAISAGVMLASQEAGETALPVREYPSLTDPEAFRRNMDEAIAQGATRIIGPLDRETVQALGMLQPQVPVIALNTLENAAATSPNLIQFGLPPEDEAEATAARLLAQGSLRALVLAPSDALGERMLKAFSERLTAGGGRVVDVMRYGNQSSAWNAQAQLLLKTQPNPLNGSPAMREDADALFLVARARDAQHWVPVLRAEGAGNLPILATSHVYEGAPKPASDRSKDGLYFCDMPLILGYAKRPGQTDSTRFEQAVLSGQPRLFALGYDAYLLASRLDELKTRGKLRGQTGELRLESSGRIHRTPAWAVFRAGLAHPMDALLP
ncbi:MAG: penicillin-binding protein activator [Pseudomonadota bacterium]